MAAGCFFLAHMLEDEAIAEAGDSTPPVDGTARF